MSRNINEIFRNGANFNFKAVDYSSSKVKRELTGIGKNRNEIVKAGEIDMDTMRKIKFTI